MCRLTGTQPIPNGAAGAVLWQSAALELRRTCLAVARFPLRGRNSGGTRRSGRVSTSSLLTQLVIDEEAHGVSLLSMNKGSQVVPEETAGLVRGRGGGRRRLGQEKPGSLKRTGPLQEVSLVGKTGGCGGVSSDCQKETPLENFHQGKHFVKWGKTDPPVSARPKITPSLRYYFKILPLVASEDSTRLMGLEEEAQPFISKRMEVWKRQAITAEGKKISARLLWWILIYKRIRLVSLPQF
ncbi:hypothetical protein NDU88_006258 [Pleurodeles waltl]|uniref:Uncharacterized protein n=1 Tax=Pleurodeles waltl TaxID=8319 RepID=A0AAV7TDG0_PLEWA|nr:hypothetical protein NDU88_006258 [Pleurodeles waltl]